MGTIVRIMLTTRHDITIKVRRETRATLDRLRDLQTPRLTVPQMVELLCVDYCKRHGVDSQSMTHGPKFGNYKKRGK
jgi:hypothetical protein